MCIRIRANIESFICRRNPLGSTSVFGRLLTGGSARKEQSGSSPAEVGSRWPSLQMKNGTFHT